MSQVIVGIREFKARLGMYLQQVKDGATVIITERGKPIGQIIPVRQPAEDKVKELLRAELVAWSGTKLRPLMPVARPRGKRTVAELLLEDRE